jgi:hypothetical protein
MGEDPDALEAARSLAIGVENAHLHRLLEGGSPLLLDDLLGRSDASA